MFRTIIAATLWAIINAASTTAGELPCAVTPAGEVCPSAEDVEEYIDRITAGDVERPKVEEELPRWSDDPLGESWEIYSAYREEGRCYIELKISEEALDPGMIVMPESGEKIYFDEFRDRGATCGPEGVNLYSFFPEI